MDDSVELYYYDEGTKLQKKLTFDYMVRVTEEADSSSFDVQPIGETEEFLYELGGVLQQNIILKKALKNIWKVHKYNEEYIAFLLGSYSDEQFREIAESYAEPMQEDINGEQLFIASNIICSTLNQSLNTTDLSILLNVTPSYIEQTTRLLDYTPEACEGE
jgi:hypothetical protein